jgi:hypothetical protein
MRLDKKLKSIVLIYEDEECVQLIKEEAIKFQNIIKAYFAEYNTSLLERSYTLTGAEIIDITNDLNYTVIRNGITPDNITYR